MEGGNSLVQFMVVGASPICKRKKMENEKREGGWKEERWCTSEGW